MTAILVEVVCARLRKVTTDTRGARLFLPVARRGNQWNGHHVEAIRRDRIEPAVARREWTRAAVAAANGLNAVPS
ncbi:MAG: hypothetical protein JO106_04205 [Mycobacterium sp.]|nr:hypothetical protein [Mycobacterium sp.]